MKKIFYLLLSSSIILSSCGGGNNSEGDKDNVHENNSSNKIEITVKGSDTQLPLTQKEAEEYMKQDKNASISVVGGGSGVGISALIDGTTDMAMSSRDLKTEERLKLKGENKEVKESIVAYDALAVVVNSKNKVAKLTREQLEDIFTGKISNWKQVGGDDQKIIVYSRESSSGTYEFFKEHVMNKKNYASNVLSLPATGTIIQSVGQTPGAIGYVGIAYIKNETNVKPVAASYDQGKTFVMPTIETAKDKTYPISRPLYYFYTADKESKVKALVDFVMSDKGQAVVKEVGFVPVK